EISGYIALNIHFVSALILTFLVNTFASNAFPTSKVWKCYVCRRIFTKLEQLKEHCQQQHPNLPYVCDLCGSSMKYSQNLKRHQLTHNGEKPQVCPLCKKAFAQKSTLSQHTKTRTEKPHCCNECSRCFKREQDFERHKLAHREEKTHICAVCRKNLNMRVD
ncbi:hypothetical protein CDAR_101061, partial [Caerostris darwini]